MNNIDDEIDVYNDMNKCNFFLDPLLFPTERLKAHVITMSVLCGI